MSDLNPEKLRAMLKDWNGVLKDKSQIVGRLRRDLAALEAQGKKADVSSVLAFYESVRVAGMAAGKVELLEQLVGVNVSSPPATPPPTATGEDFTL